MSATAAPAKPASLWEDFVDIFYAPTSVFARRREGKFGIALLVYVVLATGVWVAMRPMMQPIFDRMAAQTVTRARAQNPELSDAQAQQIARMQDKFTTGGVGAAVGFVTSAFFIFLVGVVLWAVAKLFDSSASAGQAVMVATYAFFPRLLGSVVGAVLLYLTPPEELTSMASMTLSPGRFVDAEAQPVLAAFLARFDPFVLWTTVLLGIGIAVVGKTERGKGLAAAFTVWALATLAAVGQVWSATA